MLIHSQNFAEQHDNRNKLKVLIVFSLAYLVCLCPGQQTQTSDEITESQQPWTASAATPRLPSNNHGAIRSRESVALLLLALHKSTAFKPSGPATKFPAMGSTRMDFNLQRHSPILAAVGTPAESVEATLDTPVVAHAVSPGQAEKQLFQCDSSCDVWEDFRWDSSALGNLQAAAAIVGKYIPGTLGANAQALEFWGKHSARLSYFITNAAAGIAAFGIFGKNRGSILDGFSGDLINLGTATGLILEAIMTYEADWQRITNGKYAMPWDMAAGHRQTTLPYALRQSARFVEEAVGTMERRARGSPEDRKIWLKSGGMYPEYYKTNFHYQTDGWMSSKSAAVYETATETLFLGKQDAMQRTSLLPLQGLKGLEGRPAKILEVACGTGRFATFIRDNHPTAELTCVDLSPFYLQAARENDEYWRNFKSRGRAGELHTPAQFVQAAAEALPFEGESFDAVVCVYLFHEMPEAERAAAAAEMARVLRPGGTLVLTDSFQRGDRPVPDSAVDGFENLNEPHVSNYFDTHLADLFMPHGLECGHKYVTSVSKTLSFSKPSDSSGGDAPVTLDLPISRSRLRVDFDVKDAPAK